MNELTADIPKKSGHVKAKESVTGVQLDFQVKKKMEDSGEIVDRLVTALDKKEAKISISPVTGKDPVLVDAWAIECRRCQKANKWDDATFIAKMSLSTRDRAKIEWIRFETKNEEAMPDAFIKAIQGRFGQTLDQAELAVAKLHTTFFDKGDDFDTFFNEITAQMDSANMSTCNQIIWVVSTIVHPNLIEHLVGKKFNSINAVRSFCIQMLDCKERVTSCREKKLGSARPTRAEQPTRADHPVRDTSRDRTVQFNDDSRARSASRSPSRVVAEAFYYEGNAMCWCCGGLDHRRIDCPLKTNAPSPARPTQEMFDKAKKELEERKKSKN